MVVTECATMSTAESLRKRRKMATIAVCLEYLDDSSDPDDSSDDDLPEAVLSVSSMEE